MQLLLRSSFVIPNVLCILHTAPCFLSPELTGFDTLFHRVLCTILNASMEDELAWLEATLPVSCGGIGIRRSVQLAPSAYLASTSGCSELIPQILPSCLKSSSDLHVECALNIWQSIHKHLPPSLPSSRRQCVWDFAVVEAYFEVLVDSTPDMETRARLLAVAYPESGAWLQALPLSFIGLRMDDDVICIAVSLRLGVAMRNPHVCACCGAQVTSLGTHGLNCRLSKGRHSRHAAINDILKRALESSKFPSHLEPSGLYRSDDKRPILSAFRRQRDGWIRLDKQRNLYVPLSMERSMFTAQVKSCKQKLGHLRRNR